MKFIISSTALFALAAMPALAQQVIGVSPTQAVIHYQAPNSADCQVKVSRNSSLTPLAHDVDPVLFSGSDVDSRPGNVISPSKTDRYFVVGHKRADVAADGQRYSRALEAFSEYFYRVSCSGNVQTGRFVTANPPLGNDYPEPPPFDATAFGNWAWPTIDWNDQSRTYIDPMTGILFKRATGPGWFGQMQSGFTFASALDLNALSGLTSGWTNVNNILSGTASVKAGYTGAGGDPIFLAFDPAQLVGYNNKQFSGWSPNTQTLDNILLRVFGTGTGTVSACLSDDSGGHCASPAFNVAALQSGGGNPAGTFPVACGSDSATGCFPNNGFWGGWNFTPTRGQMAAYSGTVNVSGSTVTAGSNTSFSLNWKPGSKVSIAGTAPACASNLCTISLVNSSTSLTIVEVVSSVNNAVFRTANSGVMVWINKAGSTYSASISASVDFAYSDQSTMPAAGSTAQCSPHPTTVSYAADGVTPIAPVAGELCLATHPNGPGQYLFLLIPSTGETRYLAPIFFTNPSDPVADQVSSLRGLPNSFDVSDPNTIYAQGISPSGTIMIFSGTYNAATYKYRTYSHSLYPLAKYNPGQDSTQNPFQDPAWSDTGITWVNRTKASQGKDLGTQIAVTDPNWDATIYNGATVTRVGNSKAFATNTPTTFGETIGLFHAVDLNTGAVYANATSYGTFPARWCAVHSDVIVDGWYGMLCNPLGGAYAWQGNSSLIGIGPWQLTPTAVLKNGSFSNDTSLTATSPMDACGTIPSFLSSVLPANPSCVTFKSAMACSHTPNPVELAKWPCETNPSWSEIQQVAPGDGLFVLNGHAGVETLLVVSVTNLGSGSYQFTAVRGTTSKGALAAPSGWTAYAVPPLTDCSATSSCTGGAPGYWYKLSDPTFQWRVDPGVFAGHSDLGSGPKAGTSTYCYTGVCRYNVPFEQQIDDRFKTAKKYQDGSFAGVQGSVAMQGYPSLRQLNAPLTEQVWLANYRHLNPSFGAGPEVQSDIGAVSYSLVPGTSGVYKFTSVNGGLHYKQVPVAAFAGYHLLKDVSSPTRGNIITDATQWQLCVVLTAGECRTGSAAGEVYMSVPQGLTRGDQNCVANWYDDNFPCAFSSPAKAGYMVQEGTSKDDPNGTNWRRISMGFSGYGRQFEFGTFIPDPTGTWAFSEGYWLDGVRNDLMIAKLPPWPNPQDVTVNRTNFIQQSVQIGAGQNLTSARVRFGYTENGNVSDFFCTARQETCVTAGSASSANTPYWFISENQGWQSCSSGCTVSVPAIPGRVLFYAVDRQDGAGNTVPGSPQVVVVR
ncbi:MAG TPA: hypothetical protein VGM43_27565 [Bryobacteraceae bacterium]